MGLYLDTSCFMKLLQIEPETARVRTIVENEPEVLVSDLAEFEVFQVLQAERLGGRLTRTAHEHLLQLLRLHRATPPFVHVALSGNLVRTAQAHAKTGPFCRTLDRLHLAAMEALGVQRLLTNDAQQAAAARALGFGVVLPR